MRNQKAKYQDKKTLAESAGRPYLLHAALLLNLALSELLQQHQFGLLQSQLLLQLLDDALPLLRGTLLHAEPAQETMRLNQPTSSSPLGVAPTISLSVSVFVKQWPFIRGLDGSLSDSTITSSGDGGCFSFLTVLLEDNARKELYFKIASTQFQVPRRLQFGSASSRGQGAIVLWRGPPWHSQRALGHTRTSKRSIMQ